MFFLAVEWAGEWLEGNLWQGSLGRARRGEWQPLLSGRHLDRETEGCGYLLSYRSPPLPFPTHSTDQERKQLWTPALIH